MTNDLLTKRRVPARQAMAELPPRPGLYAVFADDPISLPHSFRENLATRDGSGLLYIGQASISLLDRVWNQECHHKKPGTFFRSIGVMLGYVAVVGGANYKFSASDKAKITAWILNKLSISWTELPTDALDCSEKDLIRKMCPILNYTHNPRSFPHLAELRAISRKVSSL